MVAVAGYALGAIVVGVLAYRLLPQFGKSYWMFRGPGIVVCPETEEPAAVRLRAWRGAVARMCGHGDFRLQDCSRWPRHQDCGEQCLRQLELAPENCLLRAILQKWYRRKSCVFCRRPLAPVDWMDHKPALLNPGGKTIEWRQIPVERLSEILATHQPVCWNCHIVETFLRLYPDLVVERPWLDRATFSNSKLKPEHNSRSEMTAEAHSGDHSRRSG